MVQLDTLEITFCWGNKDKSSSDNNGDDNSLQQLKPDSSCGMEQLLLPWEQSLWQTILSYACYAGLGENTHTPIHTHARMHARTHARTHAHETKERERPSNWRVAENDREINKTVTQRMRD